MLKRTEYTKTISAKDVKRNVIFIDAKDRILGRIATEAAKYLQGKNKVNYVANIDMGDYVVITNAKRFRTSGTKEDYKKYVRYSGYQGGLTESLLVDLKRENPAEPLKLAIKGMVPDNKLKSKRMKRLFVFEGSDYTLPEEVLEIIDAQNAKDQK